MRFESIPILLRRQGDTLMVRYAHTVVSLRQRGGSLAHVSGVQYHTTVLVIFLESVLFVQYVVLKEK